MHQKDLLEQPHHMHFICNQFSPNIEVGAFFIKKNWHEIPVTHEMSMIVDISKYAYHFIISNEEYHFCNSPEKLKVQTFEPS